jgi:transcription initiation factor TFIIIB Brf1 subunit/transcription initiation factor TFIIB
MSTVFIRHLTAELHMRCPICNGIVVLNPLTGEYVCSECGYVVESVAIEEKQGINIKHVKKFPYRSFYTKEESLFIRARRKLASVSLKLNINEQLRNDILREFVFLSKRIKRDRIALLVVLVYLKLREYDRSISLLKVVKAFREANSRVTVGRALKILSEMHRSNYRTETWGSVIEDISSRLARVYGVGELKTRLLLEKYVNMLRLQFLGRSRRNVVSALAYLLLKQQIGDITIEEFARAVGVYSSSLRKNVEYVSLALLEAPLDEPLSDTLKIWSTGDGADKALKVPVNNP